MDQVAVILDAAVPMRDGTLMRTDLYLPIAPVTLHRLIHTHALRTKLFSFDDVQRDAQQERTARRPGDIDAAGPLPASAGYSFEIGSAALDGAPLLVDLPSEASSSTSSSSPSSSAASASPSASAAATRTARLIGLLTAGTDARRTLVLIRTPYNKSAKPCAAACVYWAHTGRAAAGQDCRGRFSSGGAFYKYTNEALDG